MEKQKHFQPPDKQTYKKKIVVRFGGQKEFEFVVPQPEMKEAAN